MFLKIWACRRKDRGVCSGWKRQTVRKNGLEEREENGNTIIPAWKSRFIQENGAGHNQKSILNWNMTGGAKSALS